MLLTLALALAAAYPMLTRGFLGRWIFEWRLSAMLGADVRADGLKIDGRSVVIYGAEILTPRLQGPAARIVRVDELRAGVGLFDILRGNIAPDRVDVEGLRVRLSQGVADGKLNLPPLQLPASKGGAWRPPSVRVGHGLLEMGEHTPADEYSVLKSIPVRGEVVPEPGGLSSVIRLEEEKPSGEAGGIHINGRLDEKSLELTLRELPLEMFSPSAVPTRLREMIGTLDLKGTIPSATFRANLEGDALTPVHALVELAGVGLTLPIEPKLAEGVDSPERLRMHDVSGRLEFAGGQLRADLAGTLEDLPYSVTMRWQGLRADSPFVCELATRGFRLQKRPKLVGFVPPIVSERLGNFSDPDAIVDSKVVVRRDAPGEPVRVGGTLSFREGRASFFRFPYEFADLAGEVEFDDESLTIRSITGRAATGATIAASGRIGPLNDDAGVDLDIRVNGVPIDEQLERGMGPKRRPIIDALLSRPHYESLLARGLIATPARHEQARRELDEILALQARGEGGAELQGRIAEVRERLETPVFALGGIGDVALHIVRKAGPESIWNQRIEVTLREASLLPRVFPLPVLARGVKVIVLDDSMEIEGGTYSALRGGEATLHALANEHGENPEVRVSALGIPLDDLLIEALPGCDRPWGAEGASAPAGQARTLRDVLRDMGFEGQGRAEVWVGSGLRAGGENPGEHSLGLSVHAQIDKARARPRPGGLELEDLAASIYADQDSLSIDAAGRIVEPATAQADAQAAADLGFSTVVRFGEHRDDLALSAEVAASNLRAQSPLERLVEVFSADAAGQITALRERYSPSGRLGTRVLLSQAPGGELGMTVVVSPGGALDVRSRVGTGEDSREIVVRAGPWHGQVRVMPGEKTTFLFDDFETPLRVEGLRAGTLRMNGSLVRSGEELTGGDLRLGVTDGAFGSSLVELALGDILGEGAAGIYRRWRPLGLFDLDVALGEKPGGGWDVAGTLIPKELVLETNRRGVAVDRVSGRIGFTAHDGRWENLELGGPAWTLKGDGSWLRPAEGGIAAQGTLDLAADGLGEDLRAVLPAGLAGLFDDLRVKVGGSMRMPRCELSLGATLDGELSARARGEITVTDAGMEPGVSIESADGQIAFDVDRPAAGPPRYDIAATLSRARAAGVQVSNAKVRILSGEDEGEVFVPLIEADCYGGRLSGDATLRPSPLSELAREYSAELRFSGVGLNELIEDLSQVPAPPQSGQGRPVVDAGVTMAGLVNDPNSRRGRLVAMAGGGRVLSLPLLTPLMEISNFQLPFGEELASARAIGYIKGPTVYLERVSVFSPGLELRGFGTIGWPSTELEMYFNSRSTRQIPLISRLMQGLRDELITTSVRGTLRAPDVSTQMLRGTRRLLDRLTGGDESEQRLRMDQMERAMPAL